MQSTVPLPPLSEQRAIARTLRVVQQAKDARQRELTIERERKAALMEHLFTNGTRGEPRKLTEIGEVPESWRVVTVDSIKADFRGSLVAGPFGSNIGKRFFMEKGVPVIRGNNLTKGDKWFIDRGFVFVTEEKAQELKSCTALPNDLIITAAGTLGQVGIIPNNCLYSKYIISNKQIRLRMDESKIKPLFLFHWFATPYVQTFIGRRKTGTSIPVINLSIVKNIPVPLPSSDEQTEVVKTIQNSDARISALECEFIALDEFFRALLDDLMTGRVSTMPLLEAKAPG